jgi:hypothetical protein
VQGIGILGSTPKTCLPVLLTFDVQEDRYCWSVRLGALLALAHAEMERIQGLRE